MATRKERLDEWLDGRDPVELNDAEVFAMRSERLICGYRRPSANYAPCMRPPKKDADRCRTHDRKGNAKKGPEAGTYKHGLYAEAFKGELRKKFTRAAGAEDPLNLIPEVSAQRALFAEYISRFEPGMSVTREDIDYLMRWGDTIGKTVERIFRARALGALTIAEIEFLKVGILVLLESYVPDPERRLAFIAGLVKLIPDRPSDIIGSDVGKPDSV